MDDDFFYSIDRLVEFGLGMGMAQQMVKTMNQSFSEMTIPGVNNPMQNISATYIVVDNAQAGPFSDEELKILIANGKLKPDTLAWKNGIKAWTYAKNIPSVNRLFALAPPMVPTKK